MKLPGVRFISGDAKSKKVVIEYDPGATDVAAIEEAMEEEGYPVSR
jgi:copper chaperone CopZ